jgi:hypothetical protein
VVLASVPNEEAEYLRDYDDYCRIVR